MKWAWFIRFWNRMKKLTGRHMSILEITELERKMDLDNLNENTKTEV